jgi:acylphosphatase
MMEPQQREVWYSGHVQGVGFRYTTVMIARRYAVSGFVRNVPDGRVHLVVEGERDELEAFLKAILEQMGSLVRDVRSVGRPATGEYREFGIR